MILLDTNVISELMKPEPDAAVARWLAAQPASALHVSAVTLAEIFYGIRLLPAGKRRNALQDAAQATFDEEFAGRVLSFGAQAARHYAAIASDRRRAGRPISSFDAQIAAIAQAAGAQLATRNGPDYEGCGLRLINPWAG